MSLHPLKCVWRNGGGEGSNPINSENWAGLMIYGLCGNMCTFMPTYPGGSYVVCRLYPAKYYFQKPV